MEHDYPHRAQTFNASVAAGAPARIVVGMQGCTDEHAPDVNTRLAALEQTVADVLARLAEMETQLSQFPAVRRQLEMKSARTGEMTNRIAQRIAKCETAIEILARVEDSETLDHA